MDDETIIYLIRHVETIDENGIRNTNEDNQTINEKKYCLYMGKNNLKN